MDFIQIHKEVELMGVYSVNLPEDLFRRLQKQAAYERRTVDDLVQRVLVRQLPAAVTVEDDLPPLLKAELLAMAQLSDAALWALARSSIPADQLYDMTILEDDAGERELTAEEQLRQAELLRQYDEVILRRAHAAVLLQSRGYDMSDPRVLDS